MTIPTYGAAPLSKTFLIIRLVQLTCLAGIVGITANFVSEIVSIGATPPSEIIAVLTIVRIPFFLRTPTKPHPS